MAPGAAFLLSNICSRAATTHPAHNLTCHENRWRNPKSHKTVMKHWIYFACRSMRTKWQKPKLLSKRSKRYCMRKLPWQILITSAQDRRTLSTAHCCLNSLRIRVEAHVNSVEQTVKQRRSHKISGTDAQKFLLPQKKCWLLAASIDSFRPVMLSTLLTYHDQVANLVSSVWGPLLWSQVDIPKEERQFHGMVMHYGLPRKHDTRSNKLPWEACFSLA